MDNYKKVMVALDHTNVEEAYRLVEELGEKISWFKVGPVLFTRAGDKIIEFLHQKNKKIFLDLKLHDIPNVVSNTIKQISDMGVEYTTLHCVGGRRMLEQAAHQCRDSQLKILGVTLLTSHDAEDSRLLGWQQTEAEIVLNLLTLALESRIAGIVCSPHEIQKVREKTIPGFQLVTPGIRLPQREIYQDDQKRIATPKQALEWGADFIVIGRPITAAREPKQVVERLFEV